MTSQELSQLRLQRKRWSIRKNIIMESMASIRCPFRTGKPSSETVMLLEVVRTKISDLQREIVEASK